MSFLPESPVELLISRLRLRELFERDFDGGWSGGAGARETIIAGYEYEDC